jgi:hypothetical protein
MVSQVLTSQANEELEFTLQEMVVSEAGGWRPAHPVLSQAWPKVW